MPTILLETRINADIETCFDLSRSIDLHLASTSATREKAVAGRTSGLIGAGEYVTWEATHFGIRQRLTSKITAFNKPLHFRDEQTKGAFRLLVHDHYFEQNNDHVVMKDVFRFESPAGILGRLFNKLVLTRYLKNFLILRNNMIREEAEATADR